MAYSQRDKCLLQIVEVGKKEEGKRKEEEGRRKKEEILKKR